MAKSSVKQPSKKSSPAKKTERKSTKAPAKKATKKAAPKKESAKSRAKTTATKKATKSTRKVTARKPLTKLTVKSGADKKLPQAKKKKAAPTDPRWDEWDTLLNRYFGKLADYHGVPLADDMLAYLLGDVVDEKDFLRYLTSREGESRLKQHGIYSELLCHAAARLCENWEDWADEITDEMEKEADEDLIPYDVIVRFVNAH